MAAGTGLFRYVSSYSRSIPHHTIQEKRQPPAVHGNSRVVSSTAFGCREGGILEAIGLLSQTIGLIPRLAVVDRLIGDHRSKKK